MTFDEEMGAVRTGRPVFIAPGFCQYNGAVDCADKTNCAKCGWNPAVDEIRKKRTRARLAYEQQKQEKAQR